jgi:hypothetical protein
MKPYSQITQGLRYQIYALLKIGHKRTEVAGVIGIHNYVRLGRKIDLPFT